MTALGKLRCFATLALLAAAATPAAGQATAPVTDAPACPADAAARQAASRDPQPAPPAPSPGKISLSGYAEAFYSDNFNHPSNRITNFRGFDNRENTFTLSNAAVTAAWEKSAVSGKITLQVGHTGDTYYLSEPAFPATSATSASDASDWKYLQEAWLGYKAPIGKGVLFQAGLFLSPIGVEAMAVKDNWNWSRSNLFFGLPFYHTGLRATYEASPEWTLELMVTNGWNSVVDNNKEKSIEASATDKISDSLSLHFLYFGGVERPTGAPEGAPWRNLLDVYGTWDASRTLSFILHADAGEEQNHFGRSSWLAAAGYARIKVSAVFSVAGRADIFWEQVPSNSAGTASAIFWPARRVTSQTLTLDYHPQDDISIRLEGRHDGASSDMYFRGAVPGDGSAASPYIPNSRRQTTITLGMTTWL
jgi:Putative beta-barrel porin-2, OmpL-like. bbp2